MIEFIKALNTWFRNFMLDDVDKDYGKILPYQKVSLLIVLFISGKL
ncbi:hypothetical protein [Snuella lapsa]